MDYIKLAEELMWHNSHMRRDRPQRMLDDAVRGEGYVLGFINAREGDILPSEISKDMRISSARIAATLNSLENKSLITRQIDPSDRRKIIVRITDEGRTMALGQHQNVINATAEMLKKLGDEDAKEYVRLIGRVAQLALDDEAPANDSKDSNAKPE